MTEWLAVQKTCSLSIARSTAADGKAVSTQSTESVSISVPPNCSSEKDLSKSAEIKLRSPSKKFFLGRIDVCVPYAIVPPGLVLSVVRKEVHNKFVDFGQGEHLARRTVDRHVYHGYVAKE